MGREATRAQTIVAAQTSSEVEFAALMDVVVLVVGVVSAVPGSHGCMMSR